MNAAPGGVATHSHAGAGRAAAQAPGESRIAPMPPPRPRRQPAHGQARASPSNPRHSRASGNPWRSFRPQCSSSGRVMGQPRPGPAAQPLHRTHRTHHLRHDARATPQRAARPLAPAPGARQAPPRRTRGAQRRSGHPRRPPAQPAVPPGNPRSPPPAPPAAAGVRPRSSPPTHLPPRPGQAPPAPLPGRCRGSRGRSRGCLPCTLL